MHLLGFIVDKLGTPVAEELSLLGSAVFINYATAAYHEMYCELP